MPRWAAGAAYFTLACLASLVMWSPASAVTFEFEAAQPGFPDPSTASGSMEIALALGDLIALPDDDFMVQLGAAVTAEMTTDASALDASE